MTPPESQPTLEIEQVSTRDGYDRWSEIYDAEENPLIVLEDRWIGPLLTDLAGRTVADIGCGTGRHAAPLARAGAQVVALDFSLGMLSRARARPEAKDVRFVVADLTRGFPLGPSAFPRVLSTLVLDHVPDLPHFFCEVARILEPGGRAVLSVMHPAMSLRGVFARFTDPHHGGKVAPASQVHQLSDYVMAAVRADLRLAHLSEHAVDASMAAASPRVAKYEGWPLLALMVLEKPNR